MKTVRFIRNIRLGVSSLLLHKLRSVLTMLGVVFGVGSVIAMLAVGEGFGRHTLEQFERLGSKIILIDSIKPEQEEQTSGTSARIAIYGLKYDDARRIAETLPDVQRAIDAVEAQYAGEGRVLVRYSGTENKARVMVEGPDEGAITASCDELCDLLVKALS